MGLSFYRALAAVLDGDWREAAEAIRDGDVDISVGNYRLIHENDINEILEDELSSDEYVLGCFNASFIREVTGWPLALIEAAQKGEAYAELGKAIINEGYASKMAEMYAQYDGYGHHFAHYDGGEDQIGPYYVFRVN